MILKTKNYQCKLNFLILPPVDQELKSIFKLRNPIEVNETTIMFFKKSLRKCFNICDRIESKFVQDFKKNEDDNNYHYHDKIFCLNFEYRQRKKEKIMASMFISIRKKSAKVSFEGRPG